MSNLQALFQPLKLGPITLKNRIFMSALTRNRAVPTNVPNDLNAEYYRQRAAGGAGLIITEGVLIAQQGTEWQNAPGLWVQEQVKGWKKVTDAVHEEGSAIFAQLWHVGRVSHPDAPEQIASGQPVYAPSAISARGGKFRFLPGEPGYVTPTAIDDPRTLLAQWKQAAVNAKEAGFDGVEIHGANGYLVHQFLDSTANHRTDHWGGSVQNRARFALEVVKAAVEIWGADRVGIKLNPAGGYNDVGMPLKETVDTFSYLISELDKLGIAYVALVRYAEQLDPVIDGARRGTKHDILSTYAPLLRNPATRVFANSGFTGEEAARYVEDGKVDGVFFGILWVANPDFARRVEKSVALEGNIDFASLFGHGGVEADERKGYADYPAATF
ncbi:FMN-linked oxidoreductase [Guyanagaster necrorhizus]|uniref:FMN-linked oxidoreductase n=1 Tax=Guyanagaster necrorhizus TaxID=856835 RepID=A0A9P7VHX8_9AGAR|nr:FMN-linked oxidoreductase [Guyanagaster necrorhizus MCA 3950]KAG7441376.1 FMN-linked oxidoreductase [Guyanagaster necrorhizus MCA 3950]